MQGCTCWAQCCTLSGLAPLLVSVLSNSDVRSSYLGTDSAFLEGVSTFCSTASKQGVKHAMGCRSLGMGSCGQGSHLPGCASGAQMVLCSLPSRPQMTPARLSVQPQGPQRC